MIGLVYELKTNKVLFVIPNVIEVGNNYIVGEDISINGVDLSKAGILVVEEEIKEGEVINPKKIIDKKMRLNQNYRKQ